MNTVSFYQLKCGVCHEFVRNKDHVFLDVINTVIHQRCYDTRFEVKDKGKFKDIINKYDFFHELK